ncbi:MAG TPA: dihydrofolate reductase family protein [Candidatus Binatia bacterium]|nr:dihydrofolate reductase family protein [Candidatus Binatia bacterium]
MGRVRAPAFGLSIDGFGAGPGQDLEHPLGIGAEAIFEWFFATRTFAEMQDRDGGEMGIDDAFARRGFDDVGAWIVGRNMFGPVRGPWPDETWRGWWGDDPPFHTPVFVLTHHPRETIVMQGGTTFHFVTEGIEAALALAREAAGRQDVRIGGGVATIRAYLRARLIDEMHLAVAPALLGSGEALFDGLDLPRLGYAVTETVPGERATHVLVERGKVR